MLKTDMDVRSRATGARLVAIYEPMANSMDALSSPRDMSDESFLGCSVFLMPHGESDQLGKGSFEFVQRLGKFPTKSPNGSWFTMWLAAVRVTWWTSSVAETWTQEGAQLLNKYKDMLAADPLVFIPEAVEYVFDQMQPPKV